MIALILAVVLPLIPGAANPAVTQDNIGVTICARGWALTQRPPMAYTERLKRKQLPKGAHLADFEEDHLVPIEVGGDPRSLDNLWPQPRKGKWTAAKKDRLENFEHRQVCAGNVTLAQAQAAFVGDWTVAFRAAFGR